MNRGQNRATLFADDQDRRHFLGLVARYSQRCDVRLYHYCLRDNPFHLLLQLARAQQLSRLRAGLLVAYVRYFQWQHGFVGHVFQGRFKSPAIDAECSLVSCGRYSERNPVVANLTQDAREYPWSSCRAYALGERDPVLASNPWYERWAVVSARRNDRAQATGLKTSSSGGGRADPVRSSRAVPANWTPVTSGHPVPPAG